jgi:twinkle protein
MSESESRAVSKGPCDQCGSTDNLVTYDDGHSHCFTPGCGNHTSPTGGRPARSSASPSNHKFLFGQSKDLVSRRIFAATCAKYGYQVVDLDGRTVQVATSRHADGSIALQKVRTKDKDFWTIGDANDAPLFGQHLWRGGGKRLVITEGEIDALSVAQTFNLSWPVVSIPLGAGNAVKSIKRNLEYVEGYDAVVFMFDMDEAGRTAAADCARLLTPGKAHIAELPLKDANEMLVAGRAGEITKAVYEARPFRPGGIVNASELFDTLFEETEEGLSLPWPTLTRVLAGHRPRKLWTWTAGTGIGKSTTVAQLAYHLAMEHRQTVGYVALEESSKRSVKRFVSLHLGKALHLPGHGATPEELQAAFNATAGTKRLWFLDHFGSLDGEDLLSKIRYLIVGCGCTTVILDHLSIALSGLEEAMHDERKAIDILMTRLRSLVEQTGATLHVVSHLRRNGDGKAHEEGAAITLAHLRGSHSIAQLSDTLIGLERNQQDDEERLLTRVRVLKDRDTGFSGLAGLLKFDPQTQRLEEVDDDYDGTMPGDDEDPF